MTLNKANQTRAAQGPQQAHATIENQEVQSSLMGSPSEDTCEKSKPTPSSNAREDGRGPIELRDEQLSASVPRLSITEPTATVPSGSRSAVCKLTHKEPPVHGKATAESGIGVRTPPMESGDESRPYEEVTGGFLLACPFRQTPETYTTIAEIENDLDAGTIKQLLGGSISPHTDLTQYTLTHVSNLPPPLTVEYCVDLVVVGMVDLNLKVLGWLATTSSANLQEMVMSSSAQATRQMMTRTTTTMKAPQTLSGCLMTRWASVG
jgi:hypothetical protein